MSRSAWKAPGVVERRCFYYGKGKIMALDGNHRLSIVRPKVVVVDTIHCLKKEEARCFVDLFAKSLNPLN